MKTLNEQKDPAKQKETYWGDGGVSNSFSEK